MSAFVLAQIQINDPEEYKKYLGGFMPIFEKYGGELLATSKNETVVVEGEWAYPNTVIMRFPNTKAAQSWYNDPEYKAIAAHRHQAAHTNLVIVDGIK